MKNEKQPHGAGSPGTVDLCNVAASPVLQQLGNVSKRPVLTLMAAFSPDAPLRLPFDAANVIGSPTLQWLCNDTAKPGAPHHVLPCCCTDYQKD